MEKQRAELSKKSKWWLPEHRSYELRHFCLQYPYWKALYKDYLFIVPSDPKPIPGSKSNQVVRPTEQAAIEAMFYKNLIDMVEETCKEVAEDLYPYLLKGVTEGIGYNDLQPPCCKDVYYNLWRKFFYILSHKRDPFGSKYDRVDLLVYKNYLENNFA